MRKLLYALLLVGAMIGLADVNAFEENNKFCIHTEPMLLADIEKHVNPTAGDPLCEVLATTITPKEKESLLTTLCKDHGSSIDYVYYYLKLRNGDLKGHGSHKDICGDGKNPLLAWVSYETVQKNFLQELNPNERLDYIAKATDLEKEKTELCHFRQSDLINNATDGFSCEVMIFAENFYGLDANINMLVEIEPVMYEVRNITYLPWVNSTASYKTHLGQATLKNPRNEPKQIYGSINYAYVEKVKLDTQSIYGGQLEQLPLLFEHKGAVLELDNNGVGGVNVKQKAYFGRIMDPQSTVKVEIIGQWAEHAQQFVADIYEYFGYGIKRFRQELHNGAVSFVLIESTEPVFDMLDSTHVASATLHNTNEKKSERLTQSIQRSESLGVSISTESAEWTGDNAPNSTGHPYPGFYNWFVGCCIFFAVVVLGVLIGVLRQCKKSNPELNEYKLAGV